MDYDLLMQSAPQIFRDLPFLMNLAQLMLYIGIAFTFGGLIMMAYHGHISRPARFAGRFAFGFLALICGFSLAGFLPQLSDVYIYTAIQSIFLNVIIGGAIATAILYGTLKLVSWHIYNIHGIDNSIIGLKNLRNEAKEVQAKEKEHHMTGIRHPVRIAGLCIFASFLVLSLIFFPGFPNPMKGLDMSQDDLKEMAAQLDIINDEYGNLGDISELMDDPECMGVIELLNDQDAMDSAETYSNQAVQERIEQKAGEPVITMYGIRSGQSFFIAGITENKACIATLTKVCICRDLDSIEPG